MSNLGNVLSIYQEFLDNNNYSMWEEIRKKANIKKCIKYDFNTYDEMFGKKFIIPFNLDNPYDLLTIFGDNEGYDLISVDILLTETCRDCDEDSDYDFTTEHCYEMSGEIEIKVFIMCLEDLGLESEGSYDFILFTDDADLASLVKLKV